MLRGALVIVGGLLLLLVAVATFAVRMQPRPSSGWQEFSISAATGRNTWVNQDGIRSNGAPLKLLLSVAYAIPQVRIVAPEWVSQQRYGIQAVIPPDSPEPVAALLQQELANRLNLAVHMEPREYDLFVLTAKEGAAKEWVKGGRETNINVSDYGIRARDVTLAGFANALQNVLGTPVIDETGVPGNYRFEFPWGEDRIATVTASIDVRFGLLLKRERRSLDTLVVDRADQNAGLFVMARIGRLVSRLPFHRDR